MPRPWARPAKEPIERLTATRRRLPPKGDHRRVAVQGEDPNLLADQGQLSPPSRRVSKGRSMTVARLVRAASRRGPDHRRQGGRLPRRSERPRARRVELTRRKGSARHGLAPRPRLADCRSATGEVGTVHRRRRQRRRSASRGRNANSRRLRRDARKILHVGARRALTKSFLRQIGTLILGVGTASSA